MTRPPLTANTGDERRKGNEERKRGAQRTPSFLSSYVVCKGDSLSLSVPSQVLCCMPLFGQGWFSPFVLKPGSWSRPPRFKVQLSIRHTESLVRMTALEPALVGWPCCSDRLSSWSKGTRSILIHACLFPANTEDSQKETPLSNPLALSPASTPEHGLCLEMGGPHTPYKYK